MASIYPSSGTPNLSEETQKIIVGVVLILGFAVMAAEIFPPDAAFIIMLAIMLLFGIVTLQETMGGFINDANITLASLAIVVKAMKSSNLADHAFRRLFGLVGDPFFSIIRLMFVCLFFGTFVSR